MVKYVYDAMNIDPMGHFIISLIASALVGALSYTASEVISFALPGYGNPLYMSEPMSMKLKLLYISITEKFSKRIVNSFFDGLFETVYSGIYDAYNN